MLETTVYWWEPWSASWKNMNNIGGLYQIGLCPPNFRGEHSKSWTNAIETTSTLNKYGIKNLEVQFHLSLIRWELRVSPFFKVGVKNHHPKGVSPCFLNNDNDFQGKISSAFSTPLPPRIFNFPIHLLFPCARALTYHSSPAFFLQNGAKTQMTGNASLQKHISYFPVCPMFNHEIPFSLLKCHFRSNL